MSAAMKVNFDDTRLNWQLWGQLVELWVCGLQTQPKDIPELIQQATDHGISNVSVPGAQNRVVKFYWYDESKELGFMLPSEDMLMAAKQSVSPGPYPLPVFYNDVYDGPRLKLTAEQDTPMVNCRVGEYTINYCC